MTPPEAALPPGVSPEGVNGAPAMAVLAALLDRSVQQIAEAAADARWYDRETIRAASDVWDNNLFPLFRAAHSARPRTRERRALAALKWMAGISEHRRRWMTEQAGVAGYDIGPLLSMAEPYVPGRDHRGHVMAPLPRAVTVACVEELLPDYDLAAAEVSHLRVERAGADLTALLQLAVPRRFAVEEGGDLAPARLNLALDRVTEAAFDLSDTRGAVLDPRIDGIDVSVGAGGRLRADAAEYWCDDRSWHRSAAGRRADAVTPPRDRRSGRPEPPPSDGKLGAVAYAAAVLLRHVMWEIRSVRYPGEADRVPVSALCRAFEGAGAAVLAAGSAPRADREAAFRDLIRVWADRGGPVLARSFAGVLRSSAGRDDLIEADEDPVRAPSPLNETPRPPEPPRAALVMAAWTAARAPGHPAEAQLQLALPGRPSAPWRLRSLSCPTPHAFRLAGAAFQGPGALARTGKATGPSSLGLHRGALYVATEEGWSASAD
ncbi:hypothetical protein [Streptomyces sp. SID9727]|uniref:hypothetical protein n=1 Tax=Streptomyces sp. SID9727 TaxID=2706114 RepID=UPI0013CD48A4|nr:hypothetical protein [Streptomyces sp. SID9727]NEC66019.1 hypothetical protein [Streptomyces sp. SID9727]